ncbi:MAG: hypothetical protein WBO35_04475 [Candidatus Saccharimonadales bacterium]
MSETYALGSAIELQQAAHTPLLSPELRSAGMHEFNGQTLEVPTNTKAIYGADKIGLRADPAYHVDVVAEVALPGSTDQDNQHFAVTRWQNGYDGRISFALVGLEVDEHDGVHISGKPPIALVDGHPLALGRNSGRSGERVTGDQLWGRPYGSGVSREHLTIKLDGGTISFKDTSTFGTKYNTNWSQLVSHERDTDAYVAEHTISASERAELLGYLAVGVSDTGEIVKLFAGREIITRDSEVGGSATASVDIRSWVAGAEAIVVDSKREETRQIYEEYFNTVRKKINEKSKSNDWGYTEQMAVEAIFETIYEKMSYDLAYVNDISARLAADQNGTRKIDLSFYMQDGKGVCRHMALLAAWLGGELKQAGYLKGKMTAEVNQNSEVGAHEWARYTAADGSVMIIDPAQRYMGSLGNSESWDYRRPEEKR